LPNILLIEEFLQNAKVIIYICIYNILSVLSVLSKLNPGRLLPILRNFFIYKGKLSAAKKQEAGEKLFQATRTEKQPRELPSGGNCAILPAEKINTHAFEVPARGRPNLGLRGER
jgi:hypothetical protein